MGRSGIGRGRREVMESYRDFRIEACKKSIVDGLVHWGKQNCPCKEVNQILLPTRTCNWQAVKTIWKCL